MIDVSPGLFRPGLPSRREVAGLVDAALVFFGLTGKTLSLRLVSDSEMQALNRDYLGLPGPTNVLSFPCDDPSQPGYLGDMAISLDTVAREAFLYGQDPGRHFLRLLGHGVLHLAGLDHGREMFDLTDAAVDALSRS